MDTDDRIATMNNEFLSFMLNGDYRAEQTSAKEGSQIDECI